MDREAKTELRLTREQVRAVDAYAIETLGIPGALLMENAGRCATDRIEEALAEKGLAGKGNLQITVLCGKGNNGGDGFVIARHLVHRGYAVTINLTCDSDDLSGDAATNHKIAARMNIPMVRIDDAAALPEASTRWRECAVVVDALLGTGVKGAARDPYATIIQHVNAIEGPMIVAVDVPSGLDVDTGSAEGPAIQADLTVTFVAMKTGYAQPSAKEYLGRVVVADIGAPTAWIVRALGIDE